MTGKAIYKTFSLEQKKLVLKNFDSSSKQTRLFKIINIILAIGVFVFCIWNLISLFQFLISDFKRPPFNLFAFIGFHIFSILLITANALRVKALYKFIEATTPLKE